MGLRGSVMSDKVRKRKRELLRVGMRELRERQYRDGQCAESSRRKSNEERREIRDATIRRRRAVKLNKQGE